MPAKGNFILGFDSFIQIPPSILAALRPGDDGRERSPHPTESVYTFLSILYAALSVILNVYLTMLKDLLSFLGLMFAKHPVTSTSTDNFLPAVERPLLTHRLESLNGETTGSVPTRVWAAHEVRRLSGVEKNEEEL